MIERFDFACDQARVAAMLFSQTLERFRPFVIKGRSKVLDALFDKILKACDRAIEQAQRVVSGDTDTLLYPAPILEKVSLGRDRGDIHLHQVTDA